MTRIDSVLALTDFSAPARHAAERAAMVARDTAAALDLLHVQVPGALDRLRAAFTGLPANFEQTLVDEARRELHELATRVQARRRLGSELAALSDAGLPTVLVEVDDATNAWFRGFPRSSSDNGPVIQQHAAGLTRQALRRWAESGSSPA